MAETITLEQLKAISNERDNLHQRLNQLMPSPYDKLRYFTSTFEGNIISNKVRQPLISPENQAEIDAIQIRLSEIQALIVENWNLYNVLSIA